LHREVLREHVFDGEVAVRRAGRGGDLLDPEHVDVGDGFAGHLSDRVPEDREADPTRTRKTIVGTRTRVDRLEPRDAWVMTAATVSTADVDDERIRIRGPRRTILPR
jgi:hypothetical protein